MRILLVDDEQPAAQMLGKGLREQAYAVDIAADGEAALYQMAVNVYDLIILEVMLPRKDGLAVCHELRAAGSAIPILMLTARDAVQDRIAGLDMGADDYLTKPFDFQELLARVRALLRRRHSTNCSRGSTSLSTNRDNLWRTPRIDNAIKHTPPNGTVKVQLAQRENAIEVAVADTGAGISPEAQPHIFERFYRVDAARSRSASTPTNGSGAGLGLSIARWVAEAHLGQLELQHSGPEGGLFVATLPLTQAN